MPQESIHDEIKWLESRFEQKEEHKMLFLTMMLKKSIRTSRKRAQEYRKGFGKLCFRKKSPRPVSKISKEQFYIRAILFT